MWFMKGGQFWTVSGRGQTSIYIYIHTLHSTVKLMFICNIQSFDVIYTYTYACMYKYMYKYVCIYIYMRVYRCRRPLFPSDKPTLPVSKSPSLFKWPPLSFEHTDCPQWLAWLGTQAPANHQRHWHHGCHRFAGAAAWFPQGSGPTLPTLGPK